MSPRAAGARWKRTSVTPLFLSLKEPIDVKCDKIVAQRRERAYLPVQLYNK